MNDTKRPLTREQKIAMLRILQQGYWTDADAAKLPAYRLTREEAAAMLQFPYGRILPDEETSK